MAFLKNRWKEGYVSVLFEDNCSYSVTQRSCKNHGFSISKAMFVNIVNKKVKHGQSGFKWKNSSKYVSKEKTQFFEYYKGEIFNAKRKSSKSKGKSSSSICVPYVKRYMLLVRNQLLC
ncbi:hypothetical protein AVEN_205271-1 [Araneus ventricosus]|uniref:Uncharacterized protein n=1 Tax=Araneus ventricosus TaxID=182803 RepID=A0A4Y2EHX7_ARAVE|nr:hypothetical protein AVEN_205271-1 [Araneus ventricosus]